MADKKKGQPKSDKSPSDSSSSSAGTSSSTLANIITTGITHPGKNDVMFGRGGDTNYHIGNHRFRMLADKYIQSYQEATRQEKAVIVQQLVNSWRSEDPPGRFLTRTDPSKGDESLWHDVGTEMALKKAAKILTERSSAEAKNAGTKRQASTFGYRMQEDTSTRETQRQRQHEQQQQHGQGQSHPHPRQQYQQEQQHHQQQLQYPQQQQHPVLNQEAGPYPPFASYPHYLAAFAPQQTQLMPPSPGMLGSAAIGQAVQFGVQLTGLEAMGQARIPPIPQQMPSQAQQFGFDAGNAVQANPTMPASYASGNFQHQPTEEATSPSARHSEGEGRSSTTDASGDFPRTGDSPPTEAGAANATPTAASLSGVFNSSSNSGSSDKPQTDSSPSTDDQN